MEAKQGKRQVKLLEERPANKTSAASSSSASKEAKNATNKPSIEDINSMIMDKLNQLESSHIPASGSDAKENKQDQKS